MDLTHLSASNGVGEPVRATVTVLRTAPATVLSVDSLTNWPQNFICTTGTLQSNGTLNPSTINVFSGHISGTQIAIDSFAPGYSDKGNAVGDVCVIKPTTLWADSIAYAATQMNTFTQTQGDWRTISTVPTLNATNGQREYVLKYANTDLTTSLGNGMRLQIPRSVTPPTQSMAFAAASSQYATKASPAGMTFTTAFTCEAWVYLNSYTSSGGTIIRRDSGTGGSTGGWLFDITSSGQLRAGYFNASGAYSLFNTYQSIPLNTWVHVAAVVGSVNPISGAIYANGVSLPTIVSVSNATSMVNAGTLAVGADLGTSGGASNFLDGYISEARVWSVAQTQAQVQANMGISLTGSETNLVALFQGNGNFNDKTSNANNLTATNGAIATQAANPYNATEYAIATNVAKSGIDTLVTVFLPTGTSLPNATLSTTRYSVMRAPYGFPAQRAKWRVAAYFFGDTGSIAVGSFNSQIDSGYRLTVPSGEWEMGWKFVIITAGSTSSTMTTKPNVVPVGASISSANVVSIERYTSGGAAVTELESNFAGVNRSLSLTSQSTYGLYNTVETAGGNVTWRIPNSAIGTEISRFYAECAYL